MSNLATLRPRPLSPERPEDLTLRLAALEARLDARDAAAAQASDQLSLVAFSGELDRLLAVLTIAVGAAAMGTEVKVFFTFWATAALRAPKKPSRAKQLIQWILGWLLPRGTADLRLSRMNYGGAGTAMMKRRMASKNVAGVDELIEMAASCGVEFQVCEMSMDLLGLSFDDLIDYPNMSLCGVSTFVSDALDSNTTLFV